MSDLKNQEQMRDNIAAIMELSRSSWRVNNEESAPSQNEDSFPQSLLFKTVIEHPILSTGAIFALGYFGAARFSALAVAGGSLLLRHHLSILPIAQRLMSRDFSGSDTRR